MNHTLSHLNNKGTLYRLWYTGMVGVCGGAENLTERIKMDEPKIKYEIFGYNNAYVNSWKARIIDEYLEGGRIPAIKLVREQMHIGSMPAKDIVDNYISEMIKAVPEKIKDEIIKRKRGF